MKTKHNRIVAICLALTCAAVAPSLAAWDAPGAVARLTSIETTYMPNSIAFQIDQPLANCAAGEWINYEGGINYPPGAANDPDRKANVRATHQSLLAALHTKGQMRLYARNKTATASCTVEFIHFLPAV